MNFSYNFFQFSDTIYFAILIITNGKKCCSGIQKCKTKLNHTMIFLYICIYSYIWIFIVFYIWKNGLDTDNQNWNKNKTQ